MIYLLRHAERIDKSNNLKEKDNWIRSKRYKINCYDIPLSIHGIDQAYFNISKILKNFKGEFDFIYSSPMTRCIQTSLQFQKYIYETYKKFPLIRIDYGLSIHLFKEIETYNNNSNIKFNGDKFTVFKMVELIDKYLERELIYKRYGIHRFDKTYYSVVSRHQINSEKTYTDSINSRINAFKNILKLIDKSKLSIICAHCETCHLINNYINKKWIKSSEAPRYKFVGGLKIGFNLNKLKVLEIF